MVVRRYPCSRALGNSLADTCLCDYFAFFFCLRYVVSSSVCCTVRYRRCYCCFALVVLSLTDTLALSLSSARFLVLGSLAVRHDTTVYFTHARTRVSAGLVCTASYRTGLDWTGLRPKITSLGSPLSCYCRMSAEVEAASRALETEQEFWDGMCLCHLSEGHNCG